jgi:DNA-binding XRE family transcriptional regulator
MSDLALDHLREAYKLLRDLPDHKACSVAVELAISLIEPTNSFGRLLRQQRKAAKLNVYQVAKRVGVSPNTIKNWESGSTECPEPAPGLFARRSYDVEPRQ